MRVLTSSERIKISLAGGEPDKIPCFFRAQKHLWDQLKRELNVSDDFSVMKTLGIDAYHLGTCYKEIPKLNTETDSKTCYDIFGNRFHVVRRGLEVEKKVVVPVLAPEGETLPVDSINWPDASVLDMEKNISNSMDLKQSGFAIYAGVWASIFTHARDILGEETFFITMYEDPDYLKDLIARLTDFYLEINKVYLDSCAVYTDVYYFGSDFGTQRSLFISPEHFRTFFKPHLKRISNQAKEYGLPVMFHTCGNVIEIIPDLIECGIDILDPVQVSADEMTPDNLSRFKGMITFNGGVSTQKTLPFGTPDDVKVEVLTLIQTLGPTGLIVAPDQEIIGDVSTANIVAMFDTANTFNKRAV